MLRSAIPTRDPVGGGPLPVFKDSTLQWSSLKKWPDSIVELHRLPRVDTPEFSTLDHVLVMHLSSPASIELRIDGRLHRQVHHSGDMSLFPSGVSRQVRSSEPHEVLLIAMSPKLFVQAASEIPDRDVELIPRSRFRDPQCEHIARALKAEAESNFVSGPLYGDSLALAMAVHLLKNHSTSRPVGSELKGGISPRVLRRVMDYIHDNLDEPLRLQTLASIAGLSPYRFAHNFKLAAGVPPHQYVIRARVERGKQMLRETRTSIADIALAVGCESSSRFALLFKRATGVTPSVYRTSLQ